MRILAFSDWRIQKIDDIFKYVQSLDPQPDVILYAGDDVHRFEDGDTNYFTDLAEYTVAKKVLGVVGNDDTTEVKSILQGKNVVDLHEESFVRSEFGFMGLEGSTSGPALLSHTEPYVRAHLKKQYKKVRSKKLIIVSHTPPYDTLDVGLRFASQKDKTHRIGSKSLRDFIQAHDVRLVVCGHAHTQGGVSRNFDDTMIANVSSHDDRGALGNFALIDIDSEYNVHIRWSDTSSMADLDSLLRINGVGSARHEKFSLANIRTVSDLAKATNFQKISTSTGIPEWFVARAHLGAKSFVEQRIISVAGPTAMPPVDAVFFDIETDLACKRIWLIGVLHNGAFVQFFAENWHRERAILEDFLAFLQERRGSTLVTYSGNNFDRRVTQESLKRQGLDGSGLFSSLPHVDLLLAIKRNLVFPLQSYGLKPLGEYLGYRFKHADLDGLAVASEYESHISTKREIDARVFAYNEDDVCAMRHIVDRLKSDGYCTE